MSDNLKERTDLLETCHILSYLKKGIRARRNGRGLTNKDEALPKVRRFFGLILAGSLKASKEEYDLFCPKAGLREATRAYSYAFKTWSSREFRERASLNRTRFINRARFYLKCIEILAGKTKWADLSASELRTMRELEIFSDYLEKRLMGRLNSLSAGACYSA